MSDHIFTILSIHIASGGVALTTPIIILLYVLFKKNIDTHNKQSAIRFHTITWVLFFVALYSVCITAFLLAITAQPNNYFLISIAIFTVYMAIIGLRALLKKYKQKFDVGVAIVMLVVGLLMIGSGVRALLQNSFVQATLVVFGAIGIIFAISDLKAKRINMPYVFITRSVGAIIATLTAFLVVNIDLGERLQWIVWLTPTVVLSCFITYLARINAAPPKEGTLFTKAFLLHIKVFFNTS